MANITTQTFVISGLETNVHSRASQGAIENPAVVFFVLHGRHGNCRDQTTTSVVQSLLEGNESYPKELFVVTFDQRNHGHRLVDENCNKGWTKDPARHNDRHALDMYSMQTGTACDVSLLIDFLPAYLFPTGERTVVTWGVAGVSLGGHATWLALSREPRITIGIPIVGCPDFLSLISERATKFDIPLDGSKYLPDTLLSLIQCNDPASVPYLATDSSNPFIGKKILVLAGAEDPLVPWSASQEFVEGLYLGENGVKEVVVQEGAKHETTPEMIQHLVRFVRKHSLES